MNGKLREFLSKPAGRLIASLIALALCWAVVLPRVLGGTTTLLPTDSDMERMKKEVKKEKAEFEAQDVKMRAFEQLKKRLKAKAEKCWREERDGEVETELRMLVETAAKNAKLKLTSLGSVRENKINSEFFYAEIDLSVSAEQPEIMRFIAEVEKLEPCLFWKRADFRQEMTRMRSNQQTNVKSTVNTNLKTNVAQAQTGEQKLRLSAVLRVIVHAPAEHETTATGGRKK